MPQLRYHPLTIGNFTSPLPIVQGGMGVGISLSGLASAVTHAGVIGVIASIGIGMREHDFHSDFIEANRRALRREIQKARSLSQGILGLNIMVAASNFADLVKTALEEKIDIIFSGAGLPLNLPQFLSSDSVTKLVPIVSSARAASLICKKWLQKFDYLPDAFVVEGPKAGGHLGFSREQIFDEAFSLEHILPPVIELAASYSARYGKKIPVIAAGGIFTGGDIEHFLRLGADGVQMGTRFVATHECDADHAFKQAYVDATEKDIVIITSPVGMPGRAIKNKYLEAVEAGVKTPFGCPYHCIVTCDYTTSPYCIAHALISAQRGRFNSGFAFAGSNAYRITEIVKVEELMNQLAAEYQLACAASRHTVADISLTSTIERTL